MSDPTDFDDTEQLLPGLAAPGPTASQLERATRRSIASLQSLALVDERHAMVLQLMIDLAQVVDAGRRQGKASAAAMAAAQLLAAYQLLIPDDTGEERDGDPFDELAAELRDAAAAARRDVAG